MQDLALLATLMVVAAVVGILNLLKPSDKGAAMAAAKESVRGPRVLIRDRSRVGGFVGLVMFASGEDAHVAFTSALVVTILVGVVLLITM